MTSREEKAPGKQLKAPPSISLLPTVASERGGFGLLALSFVKVFIKYSCLWDWELGGGGTGRKEMIYVH